MNIETLNDILKDYKSWDFASQTVKTKFQEWVTDLAYDSDEVKKLWPSFCSGVIIGQGLEYQHSKSHIRAAYNSGFEDGKAAHNSWKPTLGGTR